MEFVGLVKHTQKKRKKQNGNNNSLQEHKTKNHAGYLPLVVKSTTDRK